MGDKIKITRLAPPKPITDDEILIDDYVPLQAIKSYKVRLNVVEIIDYTQRDSKSDESDTDQ